MKQRSFLLVPTADETTWKFDRPVLFMGEWCRRYNRKKIWETMDAVVAEPYGCGRAQKDLDKNRAKCLVQKYFPMLCHELNSIHEVDYSERFWKLLLGSWFERYSTLILNRVRTIEACLESYNIESIVKYSQDDYSLATTDSYSSTLASNDDVWNHHLTIKILELLQGAKISNEIVESENPKWFKVQEADSTVSVNTRLRQNLYNRIRKLSIRFTKKTDAMIIGSYLSLKTELVLQIALGQFPKWFLTQKCDSRVVPKGEMRRVLASHLEGETSDSLEEVFHKLVFHLLPMCYLEGFEILDKEANGQPWPSNPKFIFTSNNFEYDEIFKYWTARKVLTDTPVFFGQHGNNYGTHRYLFPTVEETVCDKFITWGWTGELDQHTPAFLFRNAGKNLNSFDSTGKLLLIETHENNRYGTSDTSFEFLEYFKEQSRFVSNLLQTPKEMLTVRLPLFSQQLFGFENERWKEIDPTIQVEMGVLPMENLISDSRLVVHSYDSTGLLETLSRNIPTLAFWQNNLDHLRDSVLEDYELLVEAGIIHLSPESAAGKVNEIWDDVNTWWTQEKVQNARRNFCAKYARTSQHPIRDLRKILLNVLERQESTS